MDTNPIVLVVDDDQEIRDLVAAFLSRHGLAVRTAEDARTMDALLAVEPVDLIVLDVMMPGEDGLTACRRLRAERPSLPIILLTALADPMDRVVGLEIGADDYLAKPFEPRELLARIRAVLRRTRQDEQAGPTDDPAPQEPTLRFSGWLIYPARRELRDPTGVLVPLTGGEFDLLLVLAGAAGRVLTRDQLLDRTKGRQAHPFDRSIDVLLSRLRKKLGDDPKEPQLIKTVRGGGYVLSVPVTQG
ncbi:MAG TPA: response regulator [Geminicoccus sp.]|jgi:two-component system OmpR family response regulator|uniref:response regulator n=1 Tax=Geminicoccus sp. TaxID=2024832 RepID=UPI002E326494|nr:response regulator [Geminicoccus sp.]HEX2525056.1 response regulator [Geminicoccus sp.]